MLGLLMFVVVRGRCHTPDTVRPNGFTGHETDCKLRFIEAYGHGTNAYRATFKCTGDDDAPWIAHYWVGVDGGRLFQIETDATFGDVAPNHARHVGHSLAGKQQKRERRASHGPDQPPPLVGGDLLVRPRVPFDLTAKKCRERKSTSPQQVTGGWASRRSFPSCENFAAPATHARSFSYDNRPATSRAAVGFP